MFNVLTVQEALISLVGWRPHPDPDETLGPMGDLLTASLGIYFQDQHPLLTIETIKSIFPDFESYDYDAWSAIETYSKGEIITSGGNYYVSLQDTNLNHAVGVTTWWRQTNPFNEELRNRTLAGITKAVNDVLELKGKLRSASNLIKKSQVLKIPGYRNEDVGTTEDYLGWRIVPTGDLDVVVTIERICIHLRASEDCEIVLYKNGAVDRTTTILGDGSDDMLWQEVNWDLEAGNEYRIAYNRTTLGGSAVPINDIIHMDKSWSYQRFPGTLPFAEVAAFEHAGPGEDGWDDISTILTNQNNYGLNITLSARCDYTSFLVDQKRLFGHAIAKATAMMLLRELAYNPNARINRNQGNVDTARVLFEIDGDTLGRAGSMLKNYEKTLEMLSFDDRKLSEHCLPCKRSGIRLKST